MDIKPTHLALNPSDVHEGQSKQSSLGRIRVLTAGLQCRQKKMQTETYSGQNQQVQTDTVTADYLQEQIKR